MANANPFAADVKQCPYPSYERWRSESPVLWSEQIEAWLVTGHEQVRHILMTDADFSSGNSVFGGATLEHPEFPSIINVDEPLHRKLRGLVAKAFTPKTIDELWEPVISSRVDEMLDAVREQAEFDVVADLSYPLPVKMIADIIGVDSDDFAYFKDRSDATAGSRDHLAFGGGIHVCLGASLARLEARLALEGVVKRFSSLEPVEDYEHQWADTPFFRGMTGYRLRFSERG